MERRRILVRRAGLVVLALTLVSGLAACSGNGMVGEAPAATVDGRTISAQKVRALAEAQRAYVRKAKAVKSIDATSAQATLDKFDGTVEYGLGTTGTAQALNTLLALDMSRHALTTVKGKVSKAEKKKVRDDLVGQLKQNKITSIKGFEILIDAESELQANLVAVAKASTSKAERERTLRAAYEVSKADYANACIDIIQSTDQAKAQQAYDRLQAGDDFATVAKALSDIPAPTVSAEKAGQCYPVSNLSQTLGEGIVTAKAGTIIAPAAVTNQTGGAPSYVVVRVQKIKVPTFAEVRSQLETAVPAGSAASGDARVTNLLRKAKISVDPRFGTWSTKDVKVVPPA